MSFPKNFFQALKLDQLPFNLSMEKPRHGISADTDKNGAVIALHVYSHGQHVHMLKLDPVQHEAEACDIQPFDYDTGTSFIDGWKNFDGTADTSEDVFIDGLPEPEYQKYVRYINYVRWVQSALQALPDLLHKQDAINACSFCGKDRTQVAKLIAGPNVSICNECADLTHEILHAN